MARLLARGHDPEFPLRMFGVEERTDGFYVTVSDTLPNGGFYVDAVKVTEDVARAAAAELRF